MKKTITLLISFLAITFILTKTDFYVLRKSLESISFLAAGVIILSYFIGQFLSSMKWRLIINSPLVSYQATFKYYFFGMFSNYFGLGTIGGDLARSLLLISNHKLSKTKAFGSVLVDRVHGLAILALIGTITQIIYPDFIKDSKIIFLSPAIFLSILISYLAIIYCNPKVFGKFSEKVDQFKSNLPDNFLSFLKISGLSLASHICQILIHYFIAISLSIDVPIMVWFLVVPVINLLSSLPIAWNGLGVREFSYVYLLAPKYISEEQAIVFGAIWLLANLVNSLIGGLFSFKINQNQVQQ